MKIRHYLSVLMLSMLTLPDAGGQSPAAPNVPPKYHADPVTVAQLPPYCYAQYVDGSLSGVPGYAITDCGYEMNHFCPALVSLILAKKTSLPKSERRGYIQHAITEIKYTQRGMLPGCPIKGDVDAAMVRAQTLDRIVK